MAALSGFRRALAESASVQTAGVLGLIYLYARLQSAAGQKLAAPADGAGGGSVRRGLASSRPARHVMPFRMRDGSVVRCRIVDAGGVLSVHVDRDYDLPGLDWSSVRTIVDLGAHVGTFTIWAARRAPAATCVAVEPNPQTFKLLVRNIHENGLDGRVRAVNAAVAPRVGKGRLELVEHSLGTRLAPANAGTVTVDTVTVASLVEDAHFDRVDVLKMDIEGTEYDVFAGMPLELLKRVGVLFCEYHPEPDHDAAELEAKLRSAGFRVERPSAALGVLWATS